MNSLMPIPAARLALPYEAIGAFCLRRRIVRLELFGSVLRDDFSPRSDVDFLVTYAPDARPSLVDHMGAERELSELLGRNVDLVSRRGLESSANAARREEIFSSARTLYAA